MGRQNTCHLWSHRSLKEDEKVSDERRKILSSSVRTVRWPEPREQESCFLHVHKESIDRTAWEMITIMHVSPTAFFHSLSTAMLKMRGKGMENITE